MYSTSASADRLTVMAPLAVPTRIGSRPTPYTSPVSATRCSRAPPHLIVTVADVNADYTELPTILLSNGFKLKMFREEEVNLESAFMKLTRGVGAKI